MSGLRPSWSPLPNIFSQTLTIKTFNSWSKITISIIQYIKVRANARITLKHIPIHALRTILLYKGSRNKNKKTTLTISGLRNTCHPIFKTNKSSLSKLLSSTMTSSCCKSPQLKPSKSCTSTTRNSATKPSLSQPYFAGSMTGLRSSSQIFSNSKSMSSAKSPKALRN